MQNLFDLKKIRDYLFHLLLIQMDPEEVLWLRAQTESLENNFSLTQFNTGFILMIRHTGRKKLVLLNEQRTIMTGLMDGFTVEDWTLDRLGRVYWLMYLQPGEEKEYIQTVNNLFTVADLNEQVAVYSALPVLQFPESFSSRAAEGIRTNIGVVFDAIALRNPYPAQYLDEPAWNQLILKAFFMNKTVQDIYGWRERNNKNLAYILADYALERKSAKRPVPPQLWRLISPFLDNILLRVISEFLLHEEPGEREAVALICGESQFSPARTLLEKFPELNKSVQEKKLSWENLAKI